jgi:hypothetical protein
MRATSHRPLAPFLLLVLLAAGGGRAAAADDLRLVACGRDNLSVFEVPGEAPERLREIWFWKPQEYEGVPEAVHDLYRHIDECKPFDGGRCILITASTDGVGIVDRETRRFVHLGVARNAHSADLLPGGRVAVASSHGGDDLSVFDGRASGKVLVRKPLPGGHGVHWDAAAQRLYALSERAIEVFELQDWEGEHPDLRRVQTIPLPEGEGHELSRIPGEIRFHVTTATRAWIFEPGAGRLVPHPHLAAEAGVKSIATHAGQGLTAWLKADPKGWWSYNIRFQGQREATVPVAKPYYKLRWIDGGARSWPD